MGIRPLFFNGGNGDREMGIRPLFFNFGEMGIRPLFFGKWGYVRGNGDTSVIFQFCVF